jgi:hypothetical protein
MTLTNTSYNAQSALIQLDRPESFQVLENIHQWVHGFLLGKEIRLRAMM